MIRFLQFVYICLQVLAFCTPLYALSTDSCFDTDTSLMLHMNGIDTSTTFTDSSTVNPKTATANGDAQIDTSQFKFGGASGLFDGTGDYLSIPDDNDFDLGTGDFTVDFWVRFSGALTNKKLYEHGGGAGGMSIRTDATPDLMVNLAAGAYTFAWNPSANIWFHVALTRNGTNLRAFIDGVQAGITETSNDNVTNAAIVTLAADNGGAAAFPGWLEEFRLVKGTAVWTANFTSPSSEYTDCNAVVTFKRKAIVIQ